MGENPCNIFEKLIKSTLNFFGYGNNHISNFVVSSYSHQQQQEEDITSMENIEYMTTRSISVRSSSRGRSPPRPPVQSGGGAQTNYSSY
ncbi:hypothetical protein KY290_021789 [Solanum tuberosum]|uniref:Uncharacterized protein n=1 Tax=Solanum tuberosum TaxID=4113 RepID=A0ABQ7V2L1_SOLTU|nr:hypothetical protein KY289_020953 [Solanum tuberosum]KAH0693581.1 hypothetical protein KY285_020678 [Solanum tuberosum]KAH0758296.1 hypothetical protein KY290_021789 [Solanum tuberosum]